MEILLLVIRLFLFVIFALAAVGKMLDPEGSENSVKDFGVPDALAKPAALALPVVEAAVAVLLLFPETSWFGAIGAAVLMALFIAGMLYQISQGKSPHCHCFGEIHDSKVGVPSVVRNFVFLAAAAYLIYSGREFQGLPIGSDAGNVLQSALLLAIFVGVIVLVSYAARRNRTESSLLQNSELDMVIAGQSKQVERQSAGNPNDTPPIGSPFPDFVIQDANGGVVRRSDILSGDKYTLFLFFGLSCRACRAMAAEIAEFAAKYPNDLRVVIVSHGKSEENLEKFGDVKADAVLLQDSRDLAMEVNAKWTPTAIMVRPDGIIASQTMVGDQAIRNLMQKFAATDIHKDNVYFAANNKKADRIKIGKPVPEMRLKALDGGELTHEAFKGKRTLAIFWSTSCPFCRELVPSMVRYDRERLPEDPQLIIFSEGDEADHRELGIASPIVLEKDYKTAIKLGMFGTPSAVLIDENGVIISEAATGAPYIWALVNKKY